MNKKLLLLFIASTSTMQAKTFHDTFIEFGTAQVIKDYLPEEYFKDPQKYKRLITNLPNGLRTLFLETLEQKAVCKRLGNTKKDGTYAIQIFGSALQKQLPKRSDRELLSFITVLSLLLPDTYEKKSIDIVLLAKRCRSKNPEELSSIGWSDALIDYYETKKTHQQKSSFGKGVKVISYSAVGSILLYFLLNKEQRNLIKQTGRKALAYLPFLNKEST